MDKGTNEIGVLIKKRRQSLNVNRQELSDWAAIGIHTLVAIERGQGEEFIEKTSEIFRLYFRMVQQVN